MTLGEYVYYVELDTGQQSLAQVRRGQIRYAGVEEFLLYVTKSQGRFEGLRRSAHESVRKTALFAALADVEREPRGQVWIDCLGEKTSI